MSVRQTDYSIRRARYRRILRSPLDTFLTAFVFYLIVVRLLSDVNLLLPLTIISCLYLLAGTLRDDVEPQAGLTLGWPLIALACAEAISYFASTYQANSFDAVGETLFLILFYALIRGHLRAEQQQRTLHWFVTIFGCCLAVGAIYSFYLSHRSAATHGFDAALQLKQSLRPLPGRGAPSGEACTAFLMLLPFPLALLFAHRERVAIRIALLFIVALHVVALALSFSRGLYVAVAVFFAMAGFLLIRYGLLAPRRLVLWGTLLVLCVAVALLPVARQVMMTAAAFSTVSQARSVEGRARIWRETLDLARVNPLTGVGAHNFALWYAGREGREEEDDAPFVGQPYNAALQILVERGLLGLAAYILICVAFAVLTLRKIKAADDAWQKVTASLFAAAFVAILVRDATYSSLLMNKGVSVLLCLMFAFNSQSSVHAAHPVGVARWPKLKLAPVALLFIACMLVGFEGRRSSEARAFMSESVERMNNRDAAGAEAGVARALSLSTNNANVTAHYALLHYMKGAGDLQPATFLRGSHVPDASKIGHLRMAVSSYLTASRLNPRDSLYQHNLGWLNWLLGDERQARDFFRRAVALDGGIAPYRVSLGLLLEHTGDDEGARQEYTAALAASPSLLDSRFFLDLRARAPQTAAAVVEQAITVLERRQADSPSTLLKAKLASLYIQVDQRERAAGLLAEVLHELPALSHSWFNFGRLSGDRRTMETAFRRAAFLDRSYAAPVLALGEERAAEGQTAEAIRFYTEAIARTRLLSSEHAARVGRLYRASPTVRNDVIPTTLLPYCKSPSGLTDVYEELSELQARAVAREFQRREADGALAQ
jgi:O-antigen ligase